MKLSPDAIRSLLTSLFPSGMIDDLAREREVVVRERKLDIRVLVWTLIVGFAVGGEVRSIAAYRRTYNGATGQNLVASSFYDRFTIELERLLLDLLNHAIEEVAVPHTLAPAFKQFRDVVVADATDVRLHRFLSAFPATHPDVSGLKLYLVHSVTTQSVIAPGDHRRANPRELPVQNRIMDAWAVLAQSWLLQIPSVRADRRERWLLRQ